VSVPIADTQATFAATLVDEWVRAGVRHAVVCPGSRSTPLAVALAGRDELTVHVRLDERSACYFALGTALATGLPAVVCTTSGTAAAELHPAVVEASHAGVPLLVCTADRPPRLHQVGAPQTIEQRGLYGSAVRRSFDPGVPREADRGWWRALGAGSVADAVALSGPVHLNLAFEEPLLGEIGSLPPPLPGDPGRSAGAATGPVLARVDRPGRGIVIAGAGAPTPEVTLPLVERLGWPLLADPRSRLRVSHPSVVSAVDAILRDPSARRALVPETVLVLGQPWTSRVLAEFLETVARSGCRVVAAGAAPSDPARIVAETYRTDPGIVLAELAGASPAAPAEWGAAWERAEAAAQGAIAKVLENDPLSAGGRATEPGVARHLFGALDSATTLFTSSSMPMRDVEWYGAPRPDPPRVLANRGANGIDGVTSTALGVAAASGPVVAALGDLAFLHDVSALVEIGVETGAPCTLVVIDNGGGGIFSFLPQAAGLGRTSFEQLFGTPPWTAVLEVARGFGLPAVEVATIEGLDEALAAASGRSVVRVEVPRREDNAALHQRIHQAVAEGVAPVLG